MCPREVLPGETSSAAEERVFALLRDHLPDDWEVFHSVSWIAQDRRFGTRDGEIDFVLAQPEEAIVCLEVKGGGIECRHGQWLRRKEGTTEPMRDPFHRALNHRYGLERKLGEAGLPRAHDVAIVHAVAVALADVSVHALALAPDAPRAIRLDRLDLCDVPAALDRILAYHYAREDGRHPLGARGLDETTRDQQLYVVTSSST